MAWPFLLVLIRYKYLRFQNIFQCLFCCSSFVWKFIFPSSSPLASWAGRVKSSPRVRPHSPVGPARRPRAAAPTGSARGAAWGRPHPQTPGTEPSHTDQPAKNPYYEKGKNWCVLYLTLWLLDRRSILRLFVVPVSAMIYPGLSGSAFIFCEYGFSSFSQCESGSSLTKLQFDLNFVKKYLMTNFLWLTPQHRQLGFAPICNWFCFFLF